MRKPKTKEKHRYIIVWSSISDDGRRVKHKIIRDENPDCIWYIKTRLTNNPTELFGVYEGYERKFFGKRWIAQKVEFKRATTWKAIGEAVKRLEIKERLG